MDDARVLGAMLRLGRRLEAAEVDAVAMRVGLSAPAVRTSMRRLEALGWIERRDGRAPRLTLGGLAIAVAMLPPKAAQPVRVPAGHRRSRAA